MMNLQSYINAFLVGGIICVIGQLLMDKTKLTPAKILVLFVTLGTILGALGIYDKLVQIGGAGATIPLPGFGYALAKATIKEVNEQGLLGAFTGGLKGAAGGLTAAIFFGYIMALIFNPKTK
ncbi:stage V sporulation protein AE [Clostridium sp. LIBA-8841]|uniref:stage V sporulation protein AE n=1 Tax=Clostridium sp. LIBA-8841 TaxID=2987530 RepID=UPI002AC5BADA|nr:stage V sporulation protein AE [Clostridium sp. LIBA-8841]MDZ5252995.1 stage V sporulation protein AE [Clostridium sp. LIBA-8841]